MARKANTSTRVIQSVDRAVEIINCFNEKETELSLAKICDRLSLNKSTALGIINTLINRNFMAKNLDTGKYCLGKDLLSKQDLFTNSKNNMMYEIGSIHVKRFIIKHQRSIFLYGYMNNILFLIDLSVMDDMKINMRLAYQLAYHASSPGKLVLTQYTDLQLEKYFDRGIFRFTQYTKTDRGQIIEELAKIRKQGYAEEYGEVNPLVTSYAVPIFGADGTMYGVVSTSGMSDMMVEPKNELIADLKRISRVISEKVFS